MAPRLAAALFVLVLGGACPAADDEPPIVGQPAHFNGAVGRFRATAAATPAKVQAEDPLTYTVRVTATGPVKQPPQRPALADFPGFTAGFYVEDVGPPEGAKPDAQTWEFAYHLKPKEVSIKSIPGFPFVYFRPGFLPPHLGYMTAYVPAAPITVTPRKAVDDLSAPKPLAAPEAAFVLAGGDVLRRDEDRLQATFVIVLALLVPPAGAVAWYVAWRRLYPDAARLATRRRSRAAQEALRLLQAVPRETDPDRRARVAAAAVAGYLRQRLDLPIREPTPAEAETHLRGQRIAGQLAAQAADVLRTCAAVRFDPESPPETDLAGAATELVLALEAETWSE
jgi:hypothetical protein